MNVLKCFRLIAVSVLIGLAFTIGYFTFEQQRDLVSKNGNLLGNREEIFETIQTTKNPNYRAPRHEREEHYNFLYEQNFGKPMREVILLWFLSFGLAVFGVLLFFSDLQIAKRWLLQIGVRESCMTHGATPSRRSGKF